MIQADIQERSFEDNPRFTYVKIISTGISGEVLLGGQDTKTGVEVVIKQPNKLSSDDAQGRHAMNIWNEIQALQRLQSRKEQDVCQLLASARKPDSSEKTITYAYMITTRAQGQTLETMAEEYKRPGAVIPWLQILAIMERLSGLLARAHQADLIYNDVKPEHVFWDQSTAQLKLIDWGNVVFYDREKKSKQPCDDIAQVGELLYQLITGQIPGTTLDFGVAPLPAGLREVIEKALRKEYTTMNALHNALEGLYQELERLHRAELDKIAAELSVHDLSREKLNTLDQQLSDWSAHAVHTASTEQALDAIREKVKQCRLQVEWRSVVEILESDYKEAQKVLRSVVASLPLTPDLPEVVNLHLIDRLVAWELSEGAPNTDIEKLIGLVVSSDENRNLEALWKVLGMRETSRPEDKEVIHETIYWLSRKVNKPTIQANLIWLERHLDELAKYQQDTTTLRSLKRINLELFDQIVALPQVKPELTSLHQAYSKVVSVLKQTKELLDPLPSPLAPSLQEAIRWLIKGAQQLSETLKRGQETLFTRLDRQGWEWLDEVQLLDLSNSHLYTWCETTREKLSPPPLPPISGRESLSRFSDVCALLAEGRFSQATEILHGHARTGLLKPGAPEYAYCEVLQAREQAMREWENGQYADACATFQSVEKTLDLYQEQPAGKVLADHVKCLTDIATTIVKYLSSASNRAMNLSPAENEVWKALEQTLHSVSDKLSGQFAETGGLQISKQISAHQKLREIYQDQRADFADTVARIKQQTPPHPFVDVYEAWATGEVSETQERHAPPLVTKPELPDFGEVEDLITARELSKSRLSRAQEILSRIEQENPQVFASSEGPVYKAALEQFGTGTRAIISDCTVAAIHLDQALEEARKLRQQHVRDPLVVLMTDKREKIDLFARRLDAAVAYVQNGHMPRPGQQAWEKLQDTLRNNATEAYDNAFPWDKQTLEIQPGLHAKLYEAYERKDSRDYAECLQKWEKAYASHPFTPVYRAWGETLRRGWFLGISVWVWGALAVVIGLLLLSGLGSLIVQALTPPNTVSITATVIIAPTAKPAPTSIPASATVNNLESICQQMAVSAQDEDWKQVLQAAEAARASYGETLGPQVTTLTECDFAALLAQAGKNLAQRYYDTGEYEAAGSAAQRVLALLDLPEFPEVDAGMHRDMVILQSCAGYQRSMAAEDRDAAGGALDLVAAYENEPRFNDTFSHLCGLSLQQARAAFTPTAPTAIPIMPPATQSGTTPEVIDVSCTPKIPDRLLEPNDQASHRAGFPLVPFKWEGGQICEGQVWQVTLNRDPQYCQPVKASQTTCRIPDVPGTYQWCVEIWQDGQPVQGMMSGLFNLIVQQQDPCASDRDNDGINDCKDRCLDDPGPERNNGCPEGQ